MPHKIFINGQDDPDIKHFCQKSGLESTREPKLVVVIDKAPIYLEPNLEQGYAAYQTPSELPSQRVSVSLVRQISVEFEENRNGWSAPTREYDPVRWEGWKISG